MEMEVVMPLQAAPSTADFKFDSNCSSPFMTAPSSPQIFGISSFYRHLNDHSSPTTTSNTKANVHEQEYEDEDFEFNFSGQLDQRTSLSADELFDGGKIRPLKPPPPTGYVYQSAPNPFQVVQVQVQERGRERVYSDSCSRKGTRSLSPIRISDIIEDNSQAARINSTSKKSYAASILSAISFSKKKWKLKDLLLFRSASEGRATSPDSLRKYAVLSKKVSIDYDDDEDVKNSSFRSTENSGSVSRRPPKAAMSAHELHYTANRAVSEELKRKTFLPYKQGLLGCLGFNPRGVQDISRGIGSLPRG